MTTNLKKAKLFRNEDLADKTQEFEKDIHKSGKKTHDVILTETSVTTVNKKTGRRMKVEILEQSEQLDKSE
ncbi:hypothetical protein IPM19_01880 [bacterium]|nr:MAG: hypothetical protein IPM19_01880 [bacterium]